ncbi:MAG: hypothetical protein ACPGVU_01720 [Limisphaerales bacterium]
MKTLVALLLFPLALSAADRAREMPDFCQGDTRHGKLPRSGASYCAPVALSNTLMWLDENGFPKLVKDNANPGRKQFELARLLGTDDYVDTDPVTGTPPKNVAYGIERYVKACGYKVKVETMNWRSRVRRVGRVMDRDWVSKTVQNGGQVLLNIGWCLDKSDHYYRAAGHFVTIADVKGTTAKPIFLIHDPAKRDGLEKRTIECRFVPLPADKQLRLKSGIATSTKGFYELQGVRVKKDHDLAIIDGATAFFVSR